MYIYSLSVGSVVDERDDELTKTLIDCRFVLLHFSTRVRFVRLLRCCIYHISTEGKTPRWETLYMNSPSLAGSGTCNLRCQRFQTGYSYTIKKHKRRCKRTTKEKGGRWKDVCTYQGIFYSAIAFHVGIIRDGGLLLVRVILDHIPCT